MAQHVVPEYDTPPHCPQAPTQFSLGGAGVSIGSCGIAMAIEAKTASRMDETFFMFVVGCLGDGGVNIVGGLLMLDP